MKNLFTKSILAVFCLLIVCFFTGETASQYQNPEDDPCSYYLRMIGYYEGEIIEARIALAELESNGYLDAMAQESNKGVVEGAAGGAMAGGIGGAAVGGVGVVPGAIVGGIGGAVAGGVIGIFEGAWNHRKALKAARDRLESAQDMLAFFWERLRACRNFQSSSSSSSSDLTPNCDDCTDASPNCPNASAH